VTAISTSQIADMYNGTLGKWPDGTIIRPVLRQPGDDNTKQVRSISPEVEKALLVAEKREGLAYAVIDQEAAEKIESIPGAIGISTLALIRSEGRAYG
jgi:phosphate transport system substrate-binding protein